MHGLCDGKGGYILIYQLWVLGHGTPFLATITPSFKKEFINGNLVLEHQHLVQNYVAIPYCTLGGLGGGKP
jgi:hypothetical protein